MIGAPRPLDELPSRRDRFPRQRGSRTSPERKWRSSLARGLGLGCIKIRIGGCPQDPLSPKIKEKEGAAARGVCGAGLDSRPGGHQK